VTIVRPVKLDISGFASFREPAVIDFTGAEYFAFVGPTGSGKSTVIDAMTFALYGSAPRWGRSNAIAQALAPTANRCTVRLVFDVGPDRYVVAREVRRSGQQISQRNTVLERLPDQDSVDADGEVLAGDPGGVTAAVERVLGLSFDDFCKCIVLPQGQFQDFLKAKPAERQTILLKLLGADRYEGIRQRASEAEARAGERAVLLADQLGRLADATPEAEAASRSRVDSLEVVADRLRTALPAAMDAAAAFATAQQDVQDLSADETLLEVLRIPADVPDLQASADRCEAAVRAATETEQQERRRDAAARADQAAGPSRQALERLGGEHDELGRLSERLPALTAAQTAADIAAEEARAAADTAEAEIVARRTRHDDARETVARAETEIEALEQERQELEEARIPSGVDDLARGATEAAAAVGAARDRRDRAETVERGARDAVAQGPARSVLEHMLVLVDEVHARRDEHRALSARLRAAQESVAAVTVAEADAESTLQGSLLHVESLRDRHTAVTLRAHLAPGEPCPVCEQSVTTLPPPLDDAGLDDAKAAHTAAVRELEHARQLRGAAERDASEMAAEVRSLARRIDDLVAGGLPERATVEEQLARTDDLRTSLEAAEAEAAEARESLAGAETSASRTAATVGAARSHLAATHGSLVRRGAPPVDVEDLAGAWRQLDSWATGRRRDAVTAITAASGRLDEARSALQSARAGLAEAEESVRRTRAAQEDAFRSSAEAAAGERQVRERVTELTDQLRDRPGPDEVAAGLRECTRLEAAVNDAGTALEEARTTLTVAEREAVAWRTSVAEARRTLGRARDSVVHLGAPAVDDVDVHAAWHALISWSASRLGEVKAAIESGRHRVDAAARNLAERRAGILDLCRDLDLAIDDDVPLAELPALAAGELSSARAALSGILAQRQQAATALQQQAAAEQEQQVAALLAHLLRSTGFPRWLAGAALDALVDDASGVLRELSGGQFDLTHEKGEFFVVDHIDADSTRSVRTLSGGETFQASLALALALAQQMAVLGAGGTAQLDSIFLDEGFGTLDPDTLEVVAATLENLAHGERMVGVVTHVAALAERVPTRFVVSRDNRTSSVRREEA
jgi:exonuclease SbcC